MAYYTFTIFDLLRKAVGEDLDVTNMDEVLAASKLALFGDELNLINEKYRNTFAQGFAYHYLAEEIGLETPQLWRSQMIGTIINNAPYINNLYEAMGKQVFSKYAIKKSTGKTANDRNTAAQMILGEHDEKTRSDSKNSSITEARTHDENSNETQSNASNVSKIYGETAEQFESRVNTQNEDGSTINKDKSSSTVSNQKDRAESESLTGSETNSLEKGEHAEKTDSRKDDHNESFVESVDESGATDSVSSKTENKKSDITETDLDKLTGTKTSIGSSKESGTHTSHDVVSNLDTTTNETDGTKTTDTNQTDTQWALFQDTPQNGLAGIESMTYLTTAQKNTNTTTSNVNETDHNTETGRATHTGDVSVDSSDNKTTGTNLSESDNSQRDITKTTDGTDNIVGAGSETSSNVVHNDKQGGNSKSIQSAGSEENSISAKEASEKASNNEALRSSHDDGTENRAEYRESENGNSKNTNGQDASSMTANKANNGTETSSDTRENTSHNDSTDSLTSTTNESSGGKEDSSRSQNTISGETSTESGLSETDDESYELSYELLMQANSLMDKVWDLFDPLFMGVYGDYNYEW